MRWIFDNYQSAVWQCPFQRNTYFFSEESRQFIFYSFFFTELSRAFLCSTVLVLDLLIVMQDWDFPHFTNTLDVNLPGFHKHIIAFDTVEIQISGKWFNYGIIFLVMIFDLNMWKNQIFYYPEKYGQYIGKEFLLPKFEILKNRDFFQNKTEKAFSLQGCGELA